VEPCFQATDRGEASHGTAGGACQGELGKVPRDASEDAGRYLLYQVAGLDHVARLARLGESVEGAPVGKLPRHTQRLQPVGNGPRVLIQKLRELRRTRLQLLARDLTQPSGRVHGAVTR